MDSVLMREGFPTNVYAFTHVYIDRQTLARRRLTDRRLQCIWLGRAGRPDHRQLDWKNSAKLWLTHTRGFFLSRIFIRESKVMAHTAILLWDWLEDHESSQESWPFVLQEIHYPRHYHHSLFLFNYTHPEPQPDWITWFNYMQIISYNAMHRLLIN